MEHRGPAADSAEGPVIRRLNENFGLQDSVMISDKMKLILKKEPKKVHFFLKGLELLCIIGQNLYKSDSGSKRACKKVEGLSSWMMDAVESATGPRGPRGLQCRRFRWH